MERRLQRIVRTPRTMREVVGGTPENPPEHADFVGRISAGTFDLTRLAAVPSDAGHFLSRRARLRGRIIPTERGAVVRIEFSDLGLSVLVVGLSVSMSALVLLITRGWPIWRPEHLMIVGVVSVSTWAYRYSLRDDVESATSVIESCLKRP